ncbi:hypothetical protein DFR75_11389 [Nocardia ignorata]|uniref:Uncharacterized protein n=1 Tax=Nocardia ignorata TaxID=145285 RepID=A0A4R6NZY4_NOCIG|nr:hypothetical protein DFR75_11389 [Nocardia ignorata]
MAGVEDAENLVCSCDNTLRGDFFRVETRSDVVLTISHQKADTTNAAGDTVARPHEEDAAPAHGESSLQCPECVPNFGMVRVGQEMSFVVIANQFGDTTHFLG